MTTERDRTLLIDLWLDEGPLEMPPDTRRAIETAVRTMPQRRLGLGRSWRVLDMPGLFRPIVLIGLLLIALAGVAMFAGGPPKLPTIQSTPARGAPSGRLVFTPVDPMSGESLGVYIINADGSDERIIDPAIDGEGAWWSPDGGTILLGNGFKDGKWRPSLMASDGSAFRRIEAPGDFEDMYCGTWFPDATRLLCAIAQASDPTVAGVISIDVETGGDMRRLTTAANPGVVGSVSECGGGDSAAAISPDGTQFVFIRHTCGEAPDPVRGETAEMFIAEVNSPEPPRRLLEAGAFDNNTSVSWSPDGKRLLYMFDRRIWTVMPDGNNRTNIDIDVPVFSYLHGPTWSPDGAWIAFGAEPERDTDDVWIARADGSDTRRLTNTLAHEGSVDWGPPVQ
jgi:Tol biopolymer transport system component